MAGFKIPKKRPAESIGDPGPRPSGKQTFDTTTPGVATGNLAAGPQFIKKARTMQFEGRFDRGKKKFLTVRTLNDGLIPINFGIVAGGIGQQLVLAGFHSMSIDDKLRMAEELDTVEAQVAPDAPQEHLDALVKIYKKPYAKWGPACANQLLMMFPKSRNSLVGPAPRFK